MAFPVLKYADILPGTPGSVENEFLSCVEQITGHCGSDFKLIKLTVFLSSGSERAFASEKQLIGELVYNNYSECPAFSVVSQYPISPFKIGVEAVFISTGDKPTFKNYNHIPYVVTGTSDYKMVWGAGLAADNLLSVEEGAEVASRSMQNILAAEDLTFNDIIRQWNYIPQICYVERKEELLIQHYQSFNEVRHKYYQKFRSKNCFPAATGIGQSFGNFTLDFIAFQCKQNSSDLKVESPLQHNPYNYGQKVLVGETGQKKHAPEFERARVLLLSGEYWIFVSGTASIEGEVTTEIDSVERQTLSTIRNIESLVSPENLKSQYPSINYENANYTNLRAYVKFREDISVVEQIVKQKFRNVPLSIVQAEICRCDLLVEIEAELFGTLA